MNYTVRGFPSCQGPLFLFFCAASGVGPESSSRGTKEGRMEDALVELCRGVGHCSRVLSMDALAASNAFLISALE